MNNCNQESIAADGPFVWVVNACEVNNGSTNSVFSSLLMRINPNTGERNLVTLTTLGSGSTLLLINQGKAWVNGDDCSVVDANTLELKTFKPSGTSWVGPMAANTQKVFLSAEGADPGPQFVIAFDPATLTETARTTLDLPLENITADDQNVVAFAENRIYVLSASDLSCSASSTSTVRSFRPTPKRCSSTMATSWSETTNSARASPTGFCCFTIGDRPPCQQLHQNDLMAPLEFR